MSLHLFEPFTLVKLGVRFLAFGLLSLTMQGCSSTSQEESMKIGSGRDELKFSVCKSCQSSTPFYKNGQWLEDR